jgi:cold shock CspA family protein
VNEQALEGIIERIIRNRGFAFLKGADGIERFFHRSGVRPWVNFDALAEGDTVSFEEDRSPKGPRAKNIDIGDVSERRPDNDPQTKAVASKLDTEEEHSYRKPVAHRKAEIETQSRTRQDRGGSSRCFRPR